MTPAEARTDYKESRRATQPPPPEVASVEDRAAPGPAGPIPVRCYRPLGSRAGERLPVLVYIHGGGFTIGDLDTHDVLCRQLANGAGCAVVSVHYRLAPEHKFPAAVEDCLAATRWVHDNAALLSVDPARIGIGGDSAGGNLATVVALTLRDAGGPPLRFQLLIYPGVDQTLAWPSHTLFAEGYLLTRDSIVWFLGNYLRGPEDKLDWRASPLFAPSLAGLPPALVITAGFDPLRDEGKAYAEAMAAAGVPVTYTDYPGMIHGFATMSGIMEDSRRMVAQAGEALARALA